MGRFSIESAGRWSLWRRGVSEAQPSDAAVETQARTLLHRYGVVFRKLLEREALAAPWRDLARVYRRLEARGEIRGGHFVKGFSGEQFALSEAVGLLRTVRRRGPLGARTVISGVDPLNLTGVVTPGPRVPAVPTNRILLEDGLPVAALEGGAVRWLVERPAAEVPALEATLRRRVVPAQLRRYV